VRISLFNLSKYISNQISSFSSYFHLPSFLSHNLPSSSHNHQPPSQFLIDFLIHYLFENNDQSSHFENENHTNSHLPPSHHLPSSHHPSSQNQQNNQQNYETKEENEKLLFDSFISHFQNLYLEEQVILNF